MAVLPFGRSGVISGAMLGLGRALGETMAVAIVLSVSGAVTFNLISSTNPSTIAANIALQFPESSGLAVNVLIASGLVLFVITLLVNAARPLHRQPPPRVLGSQLMSTGTEPETRAARRRSAPSRRRCRPSASGCASSRRGRRGRSSAAPPSWSGAGCSWPARGIALAVVATAVVYALAVYLTSRVVEGPRKATDRLVTVLVTTAFLIAMVPLVSVIVDRAGQRHRPVRRRVLHQLDARGRRRGRWRLPRHPRHADHHRAGRADVDPGRPAHRRLPGGVRPGEAGAGHHVLRRRHDRHPVDRRRPVRLRALRAVLRPERPDGLHGFGRAVAC